VGLNSDFQGRVFDYTEEAAVDLARDPPPYQRFKGIMLGWDNTPRRGHFGYISANASPTAYEVWLNGAVAYTRRHLPQGQRFLFINAWNEWAEGTHLEPDQKFGTAYLEATARALGGRSALSLLGSALRSVPTLESSSIKQLLDRYETELAMRDLMIRYLKGSIRERHSFTVPPSPPAQADDTSAVDLSESDPNVAAIKHYIWGTPIEFQEGGNAHDYLVAGFARPERGITWTESPHVELQLEIEPPENDVLLVVDALPFLDGERVRYQEAYVYVNHVYVGYWRFEKDQKPVQLMLPRRAFYTRKLNIQLRIPMAVSPNDLGLSGDIRKLGLAMKSMTLSLANYREESFGVRQAAE
jgi:hypothetical protein